MPDDSVPGGAVARAELEQLARLFDRFEFAFDPWARKTKEAESKFDDEVRRLFDERVSPHHPHVS